ncbi:MAG: AAA family ATPase [Planctomycetaceae bacterium]|jgi:AAA15 family ATPase/GTPase|nr:AAA family ATPase [Planctomycetaceae bacterium]
MSINHVEIKDFLLFKGNFAVDFCSGVNVLIGANGTGKTTILKWLYQNKEDKVDDFIFIPEKDILEHARGLFTFIEKKQTGFGQIYKDVLVNAQDIPTREQSETQKAICKIVTDVIDGEVYYERAEGIFYTLKTDGKRIPFSDESSGYKKFGYLGLLVNSGQLENGSVLLWDEPENSLNPELVPILVDILLELSRNGVQIFVATHCEILANYFNVLRKNGDKLMFYSLFKEGEQIKFDMNEQFDYLRPNKLSEEIVKLYKEQLKK